MFSRIFVDRLHLDYWDMDELDAVQGALISSTKRKDQVQHGTGSDTEIACGLIVRPDSKQTV